MKLKSVLYDFVDKTFLNKVKADKKSAKKIKLENFFQDISNPTAISSIRQQSVLLYRKKKKVSPFAEWKKFLTVLFFSSRRESATKYERKNTAQPNAMWTCMKRESGLKEKLHAMMK